MRYCLVNPTKSPRDLPGQQVGSPSQHGCRRSCRSAAQRTYDLRPRLRGTSSPRSCPLQQFSRIMEDGSAKPE